MRPVRRKNDWRSCSISHVQFVTSYSTGLQVRHHTVIDCHARCNVPRWTGSLQRLVTKLNSIILYRHQCQFMIHTGWILLWRHFRFTIKFHHETLYDRRIIATLKHYEFGVSLGISMYESLCRASWQIIRNDVNYGRNEKLVSESETIHDRRIVTMEHLQLWSQRSFSRDGRGGVPAFNLWCSNVAFYLFHL